jgi:hypothetical protein
MGKEMEATAFSYYSSLLKANTNITIYRLNPNDLKTKLPLKPTQTLISLLTLLLKLEHIYHMNPAWKIQAN